MDDIINYSVIKLKVFKSSYFYKKNSVATTIVSGSCIVL